MALYGLTITNVGAQATVNGGNPVLFQNGQVIRSWKNLNKATPSEGSHKIIEVRQGGFENPVLTVQGYIDRDQDTASSHTVNGLSDCKLATQELIQDLALVKQSGSNYLVLAYGNPTDQDKTAGYYLQGAASDGTYTASINSVSVVINSYDINVPMTEIQHLWNYNVKLTETRTPE